MSNWSYKKYPTENSNAEALGAINVMRGVLEISYEDITGDNQID